MPNAGDTLQVVASTTKGVVAIDGKALKLALRSDKLSGSVSMLIDFATGRFDIMLAGGLKRYLVPGDTVEQGIDGLGTQWHRVIQRRA